MQFIRLCWGKNKQLSVVPIISVLSFSSPVKGQMWVLLAPPWSGPF